MKQFRAIIFDLDGVIVDSEPYHNKAWEDLFDEIGLKQNLKLAITDYYGKSDRVFLRDLLDTHDLPHELEELNERKLQHLLRYLRQHRPIFSELHHLVPELAARHPLAIASLSPHRVIDVVLEISGLRPHFTVIVGAEDIRQPKPDPEIYFTAARNLGVAPADCCVIEDSPVGVAAGKAAGMTVIGLTTGQPAANLKAADFIAQNYDEVRRWLG
jgi:beta-phosphoglucomutase